MVESLFMAGTVWLLHAGAAGLPAIVTLLFGKRSHWRYHWALLVLPFSTLLAVQILWPIGGMSSTLLRIIILTVVVFIAQLIGVLPFMRRAATSYQLLLLTIAVLAVVPIQLVVPSLPD